MIALVLIFAAFAAKFVVSTHTKMSEKTLHPQSFTAGTFAAGPSSEFVVAFSAGKFVVSIHTKMSKKMLHPQGVRLPPPLRALLLILLFHFCWIQEQI